MFCRRNQWQAETFPRHLFYDSNSKAGGVLMHSKVDRGFICPLHVLTALEMIIATMQDIGKGRSSHASSSETELDRDGVEIIEPFVGWAYIGSHNFTPSAWGTLSGSNVNPVLNASALYLLLDISSHILVQCSNYELGVVIPLRDHEEADRIACFERPPRKYQPDTDVPWVMHLFLTYNTPSY